MIFRLLLFPLHIIDFLWVLLWWCPSWCHMTGLGDSGDPAGNERNMVTLPLNFTCRPDPNFWKAIPARQLSKVSNRGNSL